MRFSEPADDAKAAHNVDDLLVAADEEAVAVARLLHDAQLDVLTRLLSHELSDAEVGVASDGHALGERLQNDRLGPTSLECLTEDILFSDLAGLNRDGQDDAGDLVELLLLLLDGFVLVSDSALHPVDDLLAHHVRKLKLFQLLLFLLGDFAGARRHQTVTARSKIFENVIFEGNLRFQLLDAPGQLVVLLRHFSDLFVLLRIVGLELGVVLFDLQVHFLEELIERAKNVYLLWHFHIYN